MIINKENKITVDNFETVSKYKDLLADALSAYRSLSHWKDLEHVCMNKVKASAEAEFEQLDKMIGEYINEQNDKDLSIVKPGQVYRQVEVEKKMWGRNEVSFLYITSIVQPYEMKMVNYDEIVISETGITLGSKNYEFSDCFHGGSAILSRFVANVISGKYEQVNNSEWDKLIALKKKQNELLNEYIKEHE